MMCGNAKGKICNKKDTGYKLSVFIKLHHTNCSYHHGAYIEVSMMPGNASGMKSCNSGCDMLKVSMTRICHKYTLQT